MSPRRVQLIATFGAWIVRLIVATLRFRVSDDAGVIGGPAKPRLIWAFWHNSLFVIPHLGNHYLSHRPGAALTSASRDGEILAAFLERFNVRPIRGSSSRQGAAALLEMKRLIEQGFDVAITPDGPRGPRYHLNPGVITLAQKTGALIMPIRVHYSRCWRLKTWDAFEIPKPFATVTVALLPLYRVAAASNDEEFEPERVRLERILREPLAAPDVH
ncbi:MAG: lysophospholipid acyltransferase family protein [Verrucomicrobiota bacterium]